MNSFNHYGLGSVGDWMYQNIGGITPAAPGYRRVTIRARHRGHVEMGHDGPAHLAISDGRPLLRGLGVYHGKRELCRGGPVNQTRSVTILDLPDGRRLEFAVSGPGDGTPLIFHHGTPGAATPFRTLEKAAHKRGLRFVTFSRPGYGESTRLPGRAVADVVADVRALLDHLGASRCVTGGWSGGGPHALATATGLPDRVAGALVIAGVAPYDAPGLDFLAGMGQANIEEFEAALRGEDTLRTPLEDEARALRTAIIPQIVEEMATLLPDVDRSVLATDLGDDLATSFGHGLRHGADGWIDDDLAFTRPWGFALDRITVPSFLWQGSADLMVPFTHGRWLAANVPGTTAHLENGHGHLSIAVRRVDAMLDELAGTLAAPRPSS